MSKPDIGPLRQDLESSLVAAGLQNIRVSYSGAGLSGIVNHLKHSDCLTILPHSVIFEMRKQQEITALPFRLTAPRRVLNIVSRSAYFQSPAVNRLRQYLFAEFTAVVDRIRQHENEILSGD